MAARLFIILLGVGLSTVVKATPVTDTVEIESLFRTIETNYGPLQYKSSHIGLDWPKIKAAYTTKLLASANTSEFYFTAARLLGELQDAHVHSELPSSYEATLPLQFSFVEGKTVVNYLAASLTKAKICPVDLGDELLSMDGAPLDTLRKGFSEVRGLGNTRSNSGYLTRILTTRSEKLGLHLPKGNKPKAILEFKRLDGSAAHCEIPWVIKGYPLVDLTPTKTTPASQWNYADEEKPVMTFITNLIELQNKLILLKAPVADIADLFGKKEDKDTKGQKIDIGHKKPFFVLPKTFHLFKAPSLMQSLISSSGLYAGTFLHEGKTIGYLRIPDYVAGNPILSQFALRYVIKQMEYEAQWLIIDQTNNPGGYVSFSDAIVESLTGRIDMTKHMKFAVKPTQSFIRTYAEILALLEAGTEDDTLKIPADFKAKYIPRLKNEMDKVVAAYAHSDDLSAPIDFYLMSELVTELVDRMVIKLLSEDYPKLSGVLKFTAKQLLGIDPGNKYVFTKPVFMMINELDFSAADATPAILKDYGRVTLVGVNTAGAGGSVGQFSHQVTNAFKFTLTQSLMLRMNNVKVENVGVRPDLPVELTITDIRNNYANYFDRVVREIVASKAKP